MILSPAKVKALVIAYFAFISQINALPVPTPIAEISDDGNTVYPIVHNNSSIPWVDPLHITVTVTVEGSEDFCNPHYTTSQSFFQSTSRAKPNSASTSTLPSTSTISYIPEYPVVDVDGSSDNTITVTLPDKKSTTLSSASSKNVPVSSDVTKLSSASGLNKSSSIISDNKKPTSTSASLTSEVEKSGSITSDHKKPNSIPTSSLPLTSHTEEDDETITIRSTLTFFHTYTSTSGDIIISKTLDTSENDSSAKTIVSSVTCSDEIVTATWVIDESSSSMHTSTLHSDTKDCSTCVIPTVSSAPKSLLSSTVTPTGTTKKTITSVANSKSTITSIVPTGTPKTTSISESKQVILSKESCKACVVTTITLNGVVVTRTVGKSLGTLTATVTPTKTSVMLKTVTKTTILDGALVTKTYVVDQNSTLMLLTTAAPTDNTTTVITMGNVVITKTVAGENKKSTATITPEITTTNYITKIRTVTMDGTLVTQTYLINADSTTTLYTTPLSSTSKPSNSSLEDVTTTIQLEPMVIDSTIEGEPKYLTVTPTSTTLKLTTITQTVTSDGALETKTYLVNANTTVTLYSTMETGNATTSNFVVNVSESTHGGQVNSEKTPIYTTGSNSTISTGSVKVLGSTTLSTPSSAQATLVNTGVNSNNSSTHSSLNGQPSSTYNSLITSYSLTTKSVSTLSTSSTGVSTVIWNGFRAANIGDNPSVTVETEKTTGSTSPSSTTDTEENNTEVNDSLAVEISSIYVTSTSSVAVSITASSALPRSTTDLVSTKTAEGSLTTSSLISQTLSDLSAITSFPSSLGGYLTSSSRSNPYSIITSGYYLNSTIGIQ